MVLTGCGEETFMRLLLIVAAQNGHDEVVASLLAAKADMRAKNNQGQTALDLAVAGTTSAFVF